MLAKISFKTGLFGLCVLLSACVSNQEDTTTSGSESSGPNTGDDVERVTGTGAQSGVGFGTSQFPTTRTGLAGANTTIGDANALTPSALVGVAASSAVRVLTFDTSNGQIGDVAGVYDPLSNEVTIAGTGYALASDGNTAAGKLIGGGNNLAAIIETPSAMVPTGGSATLRGTGDVIYVNQPTSQVFTGTMNATVTANFATDRVNITMNNPNGQIDGIAYANGGTIEVNELALNGAKYQDDNRTTGSVTGFVGATDLNSGSQTVNAVGILGGSTANETAAVAQITDGSRGTAILRVTAQE